MIILDTNVISELMKSNPDSRVVHWVGSQHPASLFITSITKAEILYGLLLMPDGQRKSRLLEATKEMFSIDFGGRILPFDHHASEEWSDIVASRKLSGQPISHFDAQIAAIARSRGAQVATRNTSDFINCKVNILNPWKE